MCGHQSHRDDPFTDLSLQISDPSVVAQMAGDSTKVEWLNGDVLVHTTVMDLISANMFRVEAQDSLIADLDLLAL